MSIMGVVFFLFAESLTKLFIDEPQVVYWGTLCVMVAAFEQPTLALAYVFAGALRGAGDTRWPMYVTILGVWVFRMPLVYLFVHVWHFGIVQRLDHHRFGLFTAQSGIMAAFSRRELETIVLTGGR